MPPSSALPATNSGFDSFRDSSLSPKALSFPDQSLAQSATPLTINAFSGSSAPVREIAFVDAALPDYQTLVAGLKPDTAVYLLNPNGDELSQISQVLAGYSNLSSVALFDHGSDGALQLGNSSLNAANLVDYAGILQSWSKSLATGADLLLYGCNVAEDEAGQNFVRQIAALTGADVAASTDLTGSSALGGNWSLEFSTGSIEHSEFLTPWTQANYQHLLNTYVVSNLNESGLGSLRDAINQANVNLDADTINFATGLHGTIVLTSGPLNLTDSAKTTINGGNAITISGNHTSSVFGVGFGATAELNGLIVTEGSALWGGGIYNSGNLTINGSTLSGNSTSGADNNGGGIYNTPQGNLTINNSTISDNSANQGFAGGISNIGHLTINNSTISGNSNTDGEGGGIYNENQVTINNSTISGNSAGLGGGIENFGGFLIINNSIVAGNSAVESSELAESGSVISNYNLWGDSSQTFVGAFNGFGPLFTPSSTDIVATSDGTRPTALSAILDSTLRNNGGSTQTLALVAGSPALDQGSNALIPAGITTDQRGFARIVNGTVDIGAFESPYFPPIANADTGVAVEAGGITPGSPATGNVLINDTDPNAGGQLTVSAVAFGSTPGTVGTGLSGAYGTLTLNTNGGYTYVVDDTNPTVQALNVGQTLSEVFTYTAQDSLSLLTTSNTLTITIQGTDDAPVISTNALAVVKGGSVVLSNLNLNTTDPDNTPEQLTYTVNAISGGQFQLISAPGVAITSFTQAQVNAGAVRFIDTSSSTPPTYSLTTSDGKYSSPVSSTIVTLYTPPIAKADTGTATEAGGTNNATPGSNATGNVLGNDIDPNAGGSSFVIAVALGATVGTIGSGLIGKYGTLTLNADGNYTYVVDDTNATVQALNVGKSLTETFTYTIFDSLSGLTASSTLAVKIQGADDAPIISANTLAIAQGGSVVLSKLNLNTTDPDNTTAQLTYATSGVTGGQFELVSTPGTAITSFTQAQINGGAVRFVSTGTTPPTYSLAVSDGLLSSPISSAAITFYTPPIANADTGVAKEAGGINNGTAGSNATGSVLTNDIDPNAGGTLSVSAVAFGSTSGTVGTGLSGAYGKLTLSSNGTYTYVVNNANPTVQALNVGDMLTEVFTYTTRDSKSGLTATSTLTITIQGADDAPVVTTALSDRSSPEDTPVSFTIPANTFSDVDNSTLTLSASLSNNTALPTWLSFDATTGTFSGTPPLNFNGTLTLKVIATDAAGLSASSTFKLVITPVNDAPTITAPATVQLTATNSTASISGIRVADVDSSTGIETLTLTVNNGSLSVSSLPTGVTASGLNTSTVIFNGTISALNTTLSRLRYSGNGFSGTTTLSVTINDNGNTGSGPVNGLSATDAVALIIT